VKMGVRLEVSLRRERPASYRQGRRVERPEDVWEVCRDLIDADRERFHVLHLDPQNRLLAREEVAVGTLSATTLTCREVFKGAILANSSALVLVHNHPSGDPEPSEEDRIVTRRLVEVGQWLGIPVLDHVVLGAGGYRSLGGPFLREGPMLQRAQEPTPKEQKGRSP
jgi:DNA repair protein RadC